MRELVILVPALIASGPIKGAAALANEAVKTRPVTFVSLKSGFSERVVLAPEVRQVSLAQEKGLLAQLRAYRAFLRRLGGRQAVASVSMCLSADRVNFFCRKEAVTCASVRGNLYANYRMDHGLGGVFAAFAHLLSLRGFDEVAAMTGSMAAQIRPYLGRAPEIVANFIDEAPLEAFRDAGEREGPLRFVFVRSLSSRKNPLLLLQAMAALRARGEQAHLDLVGNGPLRAACEAEIARLGLEENVTVCGSLSSPYALMAQADAFVLPSFSEGLSRASLEALYLGTPCVLRDVDGNAELIDDEARGGLFREEKSLADLMLAVARASRSRKKRDCLLPDAFRQAAATRRLLDLLGCA